MMNYLQPFRKEFIEEYLHLALEAYKVNNPGFTLGITNDDQFLQSTRKLISLLIQVEEKFNRQNNTDVLFNNAVFENGKMIAAGFGCDLHYYVREASGKIIDRLLVQLSKANLTQIPERSTVVSVKGVIHKDWQNKGVMSRYMYERAQHFVSKNYIDQFTLISNPYTLKISHKFGARIWKDLTFQWNGNKVPSYIILRDLRIMAAIKRGSL